MDGLPEFGLKKIETSIVNELLPRQIRQNSNTFVKLLEEYYTFLNQKDNPSYVIQRIIDEHDIDKIVDDLYLEKIKYEIARLVPTSPYVQKAFLLKRIIDSYNLRGNEESVKYFFRVFFNEEVTLYNPWEQVLIPSQGRWVQSTYARLVLYCGNAGVLEKNVLQQYDKEGRLRASVEIESAVMKDFNGKSYFDVKLRMDTVSGTFNERLPVQTIDGKARGVFVRMLDDVKVTSAGTGYSVGDRVYLGSMDNVTFKAIVETVGDNGDILKLQVYDNGVSSSIHYLDYIENNASLIPNLSDVYLHGVFKKDAYDNYYLETQATINNTFEIDPSNFTQLVLDDVDLEFYVGREVDLFGNISTKGILISSIEDKVDNVLMHDFVYYDEGATLNYDNEFRTLTNVKVRSDRNTFIDPYYDPYDPYDAYGLNEVDAEFQFRFNFLYTTDGYYADEKGKPSGFSVLQDSFYYQVFSYEVNSRLSINTWKSQMQEFIHPAGFKLFNRINSTSDVDINISTDAQLTIDQDYLPVNIAASEQAGSKYTLYLIVQDYNKIEPEFGSYFLEDYVSRESTLSLLEFDAYSLVFGDPYDPYDIDPYDPYGYYLGLSTIASTSLSYETPLFGEGASDLESYNPNVTAEEQNVYFQEIYNGQYENKSYRSNKLDLFFAPQDPYDPYDPYG